MLVEVVLYSGIHSMVVGVAWGRYSIVVWVVQPCGAFAIVVAGQIRFEGACAVVGDGA